MRQRQKKGKHGWFVLGSRREFDWGYERALDDEGNPKVDEEGRELYRPCRHFSWSIWTASGPFKSEKAAGRWKAREDGKDELSKCNYNPWYVVKRFYIPGVPAFSETEIRKVEEDTLEFTEHTRRIRKKHYKKPRKVTGLGSLCLEFEEEPGSKVTLARKYGLRFVKART
ncbi:MAG: hypothetical protein JSS66_06930 [Armatimonadetes bacterium]|nr:hypothetical protein [Armatimonadota bacterium]